MASLNNAVYDNGLSYVTTNGSRMDLCSAEPTTYAQATSTLTLGNKTGLTVGSPAAGTPDGRAVTVPAITDGSITSTGDATHWALTNGVDTLIATGALNATVGVTNGGVMTLDDTIITIRAAT